MDENKKALAPRGLLVQTLVFTLGMVAVLVALGVVLSFFLDFKALGKWISTSWGLGGIFLFCWIIDSVTLPASPLFVFPFTQGWDPVPLLALMSLGSILGGTTAYLLGRFMYRWSWVQRMVQGWKEKERGLLDRYGFWALGIAALMPLPFSGVCMAAGVMKLKLRMFFLGALFRIPKLIFFWWAVNAGIGIFVGK